MDFVTNILNISFPLNRNENDNKVYWFKQSKDIVIHIIFSEANRKNYYEINFGVLNGKNLSVLKKTKTHKAIRTFNTLIIATLDFLDNHPNASLIFSASDRGRNQFYQNRISKNLEEFKADFKIYGLFNLSKDEVIKEAYVPNRFYDEVIVSLKK